MIVVSLATGNMDSGDGAAKRTVLDVGRRFCMDCCFGINVRRIAAVASGLAFAFDDVGLAYLLAAMRFPTSNAAVGSCVDRHCRGSW